jgi:hypothetical protein
LKSGYKYCLWFHKKIGGKYMAFCSSCGQKLDDSVKFCPSCGNRIDSAEQFNINEQISSNQQSGNTNYGERINVLNENYDFSRLSPYYQTEFSKIRDSNETYKGKWNWAAFIFGALWALTKGLWLSAVIAIAVSLMTGGTLSPVFWILFGIRGNYIYYNSVAKNKQLPF